MTRKDLEEFLVNIFENHAFVLIDNGEYEDYPKVKCPQGRVVSPKWLARTIGKKLGLDA